MAAWPATRDFQTDTQLMRQLDKSPSQIQELRSNAPAPMPQTARALRDASTEPVASGFDALDQALGGGVSRGRVTELVGRAGAGKTQGCLTLAAACAARGEAMVYVDTGGSFRAQRLWQVAEARGASNSEELLQRVHVLRPQNREELLAALETGVVEERARQARAALVVVDSVAAAARGGTSSGRSDLIDRQRWLARAAAALKKVACGADCAVVVTNHVMADLRAQDGCDAVTAALGFTWHHAVNVRVMLDHVNGRRTGRVEKSCADAESAFTYGIGPAGLMEAVEAPVLSPEQRERIERNRAAALAKRRRRS